MKPRPGCRAFFPWVALWIAFGSPASAAQGEVSFLQASPAQQASSDTFNTVKFSPPSPIAWKAALAAKGRIRIESELPLVYVAMNFTAVSGKRGFAKVADGPVVKDLSFAVPLKDLVTDGKSPVAGAWTAEDLIKEFTVYAKFKQAGPSRVDLEGVELVEDEKVASAKAKPAQTPTRAALFEGRFELNPAARGVHPRLFTDAKTLGTLAGRFQKDPRAFERLLPPIGGKILSTAPIPLQEKENAWFATKLAWMAVCWRVTGEAAYLEALRKWRPMIEGFQPIVIDLKSPTSGNRDLTTGGMLLGFSILYDALHGKVPEEELAVVRRALVSQGRQAYESLSSYGSYAYEQNHLIIPVCALGLAAMVLADELPEAAAWGVFARNMNARSFPALSHDGWFFEGINYWSFTMVYPLSYAVALKRTTGVDLLGEPPFRGIPEYLVHTFLPDPDFVFDFADWGPRVEHGDGFQRGYDLPWHTLPTRIASLLPVLLLQERPSPLLSDFVMCQTARLTNYSSDDSLFFLMSGIEVPKKSVPMPARAEFPPWHHFEDVDVLHWRSAFGDGNATALAFKSGPPAGHHIATLYPLYPEWRPGLGHAHPDAGSFLLWSRGGFLAGDTGYGTKRTEWHNTLVIDGQGQIARENSPFSQWAGMPYDRLNRIRLTNTWLASAVAAGTAVLEDAYPESLELDSLRRHLILVDGRFLVVLDEVAAAKAHTFASFLHGDREPRESGRGRWISEHAGSRLCLQVLSDFKASKVEPTVVETQIYPGPPRPQQRGYHLELGASASRGTVFLTAMAIQAAGEEEKSFSAQKAGEGVVEIRSGAASCRIWIGPQADLDGAFAFVLREGKNVVAAGLSGKRLKSEIGTLSAKSGPLVLRRAAGAWKAEGPSEGWKIE